MKRRPINFRDALKAARKIGSEQLREMTREDAAASICVVVLKDVGVDLEDPQIDWEGIVVFIERLLPLILKIIDVFGG